MLADMIRVGGIISDHWRGAVSPRFALVGPLIGVHLCMALLLGSLQGVGGLLAGLLLLLQLGVLVWQIVGTFRMADRTLQETGSVHVAALSYAAILGVAVSTLFQVIDLAAAGPTVVAEQIAPQVPVSAEGDMIRLNGEITLRTVAAIERMIATGHGYRVLILTSNGGNVHAARGIARLVDEAGWQTVVEGRCFSACTLVFVAGSHRVLAPGASLGFHRYKAGVFEVKGQGLYGSAGEEQQRDRAYFEQRGVAADFLERIYEAEHSAIWRPSRQDLLAAGVLSE